MLGMHMLHLCFERHHCQSQACNDVLVLDMQHIFAHHWHLCLESFLGARHAVNIVIPGCIYMFVHPGAPMGLHKYIHPCAPHGPTCLHRCSTLRSTLFAVAIHSQVLKSHLPVFYYHRTCVLAAVAPRSFAPFSLQIYTTQLYPCLHPSAIM